METIVTTESIEKFLASSRGKGRSENTIKAYRIDLESLLGATGTPIPRDEFEEAAGRYLTELRRTAAAKTVQRRLGTYRVFGRWLGLDAPLADYTAPTPARPIPHPLPEGIDGVLRMARAARNDQQRAIVALCGLVGLRVSEARAVRPEDFDYRERTLRVHGKGDRDRVVPVSDRAWEFLAPAIATAAINGTPLLPWQDRFSRQVLKNIGRRAGLAREVSSHDLRATYATAAYNKSLNLRAVQELLGHATSSQTEVYTGVTLAEMREAGEVA